MTQPTDILTLPKINHLTGNIKLPGSKSISNRALLLASLARGTTTLTNVLDSDDTGHMLTALRALNISIDGKLGPGNASGQLTIQGGAGPLSNKSSRTPQALFMGLAGTAIRPLTAALTLGLGEFILDGTPRMRERPIGDLVTALQGLGAQIEYQGNPDYPPILVQGNRLPGGSTHINGAISSQFLSSLLLAAPYAQRPVTVIVDGTLVSKPYVDITLALMQRFGVFVTNNDYASFEIPHSVYQTPGEFLVEGDASSASYFLAAGAIAGPGITVEGLGKDSIQGDVAFVDVLAQMGAKVDVEAERIHVSPGPLHGIDADLNHIPDAAMTIAVLALFAQGTTRIRNIYNWRVKETDRLSAMATELRKLGATVIEAEDAITIDPPTTLRSAEIETYGDHRMAMCFSLATLGGTEVQIRDPQCVAKTFPTYFADFARLAI